MLRDLLEHPTVAIVGLVTLIALVSIVLGHFREVRQMRYDGELRLELVRRGHTPEQIAATMTALQVEPGEAAGTWRGGEDGFDAELAQLLVSHEVSPENVGPMLELFRGMTPGRRPHVYDAVTQMLEDEASEEGVLAALRALAKPAETAPKPRPATGGKDDAIQVDRSDLDSLPLEMNGSENNPSRTS